MAITAGKLKPPGEPIRHRVPARVDWTQFPNTPFLGPYPELPVRLVGMPNGGWPKMTRRFFRTMCRMPHARGWSEGDWILLIETCYVHADIFEERKFGNASALKELRSRQQQLGMTFDSRMTLRIAYVDVDETGDGEAVYDNGERKSVIELDDYRLLYGE